jgi:NAD(P)-dependent dehydrogenase (short-subunit alcohol dehydrogenase family)
MTKALFGLEGKTFIVLGGGLGMGEATCNLLAEVGANVAVLDIIPERAERVAALVAAKGVKSLPLVADVLDDERLLASIHRTERELGPLDGMATIVGMARMASSVDTDMDFWDLEHRRNLRYIYLAAVEVARGLLARGAPGAIACVASVDGLRGAANHAAYGAAKAGLVSLAKSLSGEWAPYGVRFNVVAPGGVVTPRIPITDPEKERIKMEMVPMRRRGEVQDIANALVFLLSDMAAYITGHTLAVDGGYSATGPMDYARHATMKLPGTAG